MISKEQSNENINVEPINKPNPDSDGKVRFYLEEEEEDHQTEINSDPINKNWTEKIEVKVAEPTQPTVEENRELTDQRLEKIKKESQKMKSPMGINELENEPAYKRRNIQLDDVQHSSDSQVSKFSLGDIEDENGNKRNGLNENNSFLHDNVD